MKAKIRPAPVARDAETRLLAGLFENPERLRERLVLAIALAPPKGRIAAPPRGAVKRRR